MVVTQPPDRAGIYLKLSTASSEEDPFYLQRAYCERWCKQQGYEVVAFREALGPSQKYRIAQRRELIDMLAAGDIDVIVTGAADRWASGVGVADQEDLRRVWDLEGRVEFAEDFLFVQ